MYIIEKNFPTHKIRPKPVIYFLLLLQKKLKTDMHNKKNHTSSYLSVVQMASTQLQNIITLYRDYDIKPPSVREISFMRPGDINFLLNLPQNENRQFRIWKYSAKWKELNASQRRKLMDLN